MATNVFGIALHPCRAVDGALASITAQYSLKIQNLQRPETETISMKYLAVSADVCCSWTQLPLSLLDFFMSCLSCFECYRMALTI